MDQLLSRPEIQSAVLPFVVALLCYLGLKKFTASAWIWALFAAFLVASSLINGITLTPLTGTRKIILLIIASCLVAGLAPAVIQRVNLRRGTSAILGMLAILWVFWKVVARMEVTAMASLLAGGVVLVVWLTWIFGRLTGSQAKLHGAGFSLLLGTGLSATAGASALLGQLALSLSAASGAVLLAWVLVGNSAGTAQPNRSISTLPYALAPALLGLAAVIFAAVPWYTLIPLASIPLAAKLLPGKPDSRFLAALASSLPGLFIALAVAFWIWQTGNSDSGY
jgi:hypothetical protein